MSVLTPSNGANAPNSYAVTVGIANQLALPPNPTRGGVIFYNNSSLATITVCPAVVFTIASGTAPWSVGQQSTPSGAVSGPAMGVPVANGAGCITLAPGGAAFTIDNLNCSGAWNGISSVAGGALTVLEF